MDKWRPLHHIAVRPQSWKKSAMGQESHCPTCQIDSESAPESGHHTRAGPVMSDFDPMTERAMGKGTDGDRGKG